MIVSISGLLNNTLKLFVIFKEQYTLTVHVNKHSYHNMFAHICVLCFMNVCLLKSACCYKQCFVNMRFRGCLWASLFIMGLLAGDYTCRVTLTALVILCRHCSFKRWPAATSFHNGPACWGLHLSSDAARHSVPAL